VPDEPTSIAVRIAPKDAAKLQDDARQQFQEQIDFLRKKINLPTERWDDIWQGAHDRAFIVAGAQKADLLNDLRTAVDKANQGGSIGEFRKAFAAAVKNSGWSGWTGEGSKAGVAWRTRVIYQTNIATSYAAGRWQQLNDPELLKVRPYWRYIHNDSVITPRPQHKAWGDAGLTLRHDHPLWKTHFPPNGWGCMCSVQAVRGPQSGDATEPPEGWDTLQDKTSAPPGIDKGWAYAPGASSDLPLRQLVQDKLISYPDAISTALSRDVNRYVNATEQASAFAARMLMQRANAEPLWIGFVENPQSVSELVGSDVKGYTVLIPSDAPRHVETSHAFDGGTQRAPVAADFDHVAGVLNGAHTIRAGELSRNGNPTVVATKNIDGETFRAVFEVLAGKKNRSLALISLVIKAVK
jgi:hypothetical protein